MKQWKRIKTALVTAGVAGSLVFGFVQATAEAETRPAACNAWACRTECAPFGGELGPGGPGKPLQCYCCG